MTAGVDQLCNGMWACGKPPNGIAAYALLAVLITAHAVLAWIRLVRSDLTKT